MRAIERSTLFRRDYSRESKRRHGQALDADLTNVLQRLIENKPLDERHRDRGLSGDWGGYRECPIRPDLLLIYRKIDDNSLRFARWGSHRELFSK